MPQAPEELPVPPPALEELEAQSCPLLALLAAPTELWEPHCVFRRHLRHPIPAPGCPPGARALCRPRVSCPPPTRLRYGG